MKKLDTTEARQEASAAMRSALWEYCPPEFFMALDEIDQLRAVAEAARDVIKYVPEDRLGNYDEDWVGWLRKALQAAGYLGEGDD